MRAGTLLVCVVASACAVAPAKLRRNGPGECSRAEVVALCRTITERDGSADARPPRIRA